MSLRVMIAGGGTGGHLFPGIAVARELLARRGDAHVTFVGTAAGIEARVIPREGFEFDVIRSAGIKGKSLTARARGLSLLPLSGFDAWKVLSRRRPNVVIGVGGYSSGPIVLFAALRGIPTLLMEQNAVPGLTNRALARVVNTAAVTYAESLSHFAGRGFVSGNPVRADFFSASAEASARQAFDPSGVVRLHGSIWEVSCWQGCAKSPRRWRDDTLSFKELPPHCPYCNGLIRPAVVWFGETLESGVVSQASAAAKCDIFITVGTSAVVYPAAGFIEQARKHGAFTVEINPESTPVTPTVDLVLNGGAETILPEIDKQIGA